MPVPQQTVNEPFWKKVFKNDNPQHITHVIAVTGSVGKTTVAHLTHHILNSSGLNTALISSRGLWLGTERDQDKFKDFSVNTSGVSAVRKAVSTVFRSDCSYLVLEIPANLILDFDISKYKFDSVVFTNVVLEPDMQLSFKSESDYLDALFTPVYQVIPEGLAVLNGALESKEWLLGKSKTITQNIYAAWCDITPDLNAKLTLENTTFKFLGGFFTTKLIGRYNLVNCLQAIQLCSKYVSINQIDAAVATFEQLPGRLERTGRKDRIVYVDYAYQYDVCSIVLADFSELINPKAKLIIVTGAAGDRSAERLNVALSAAKYADVILFTPQDPRTQLVANINTKLLDLTEQVDGALVDRILSHEEFEALNKTALSEKINLVQQNGDVPIIAFDADSPSARYDAIEFAIGYASPDDIILIMGKGDDELIDFGDAVYEWNDMKMADEIMYERFYNSQSGLSNTSTHL